MNRTMVLPNFISRHAGPQQLPRFTPFEDLLDPSFLSGFHRVVTSTDFFRQLAKEGGGGDEFWPMEKRHKFCYSAKHKPIPGEYDYKALEGGKAEDENEECQLEGVHPMQDYWEHLGLNVSFAQTANNSKTYGHYLSRPSRRGFAEGWRIRYPPKDFPVVVMVRGQIGDFPARLEDYEITRYLRFQPALVREARALLDMAREGGLINAAPKSKKKTGKGGASARTFVRILPGEGGEEWQSWDRVRPRRVGKGKVEEDRSCNDAKEGGEGTCRGAPPRSHKEAVKMRINILQIDKSVIHILPVKDSDTVASVKQRLEKERDLGVAAALQRLDFMGQTLENHQKLEAYKVPHPPAAAPVCRHLLTHLHPPALAFFLDQGG